MKEEKKNDVIVLSKGQFGVGTIALVSPLGDTLIKWDKNRAVDSTDDSGNYSEKSLKVAEVRQSTLEKYVKDDNIFHNARVGGWQTEEGKIMVSDANNRLELVRTMHSEGEHVPGMGIPWVIELFNDKINPKTNEFYTKEDFDNYCILMNRRQNAQWQFCDVCDYYKRFNNPNAIYIVDAVEKFGISYTIIAEIAFGQGATAKKQGDAIFIDNIKPWEHVESFILFMKSLSNNYVKRKTGDKARNKTVGEKLTHAHELQAFESVYKSCCFAGVKDKFEEFMLSQFHRGKLVFEAPAGQKQKEWQMAINNFINQPIEGKMETTRLEITNALKVSGVKEYYDTHKNSFPITFDNWEYKLAE